LIHKTTKNESEIGNYHNYENRKNVFYVTKSKPGVTYTCIMSPIMIESFDSKPGGRVISEFRYESPISISK